MISIGVSRHDEVDTAVIAPFVKVWFELVLYFSSKVNILWYNDILAFKFLRYRVQEFFSALYFISNGCKLWYYVRILNVIIMFVPMQEDI
jgi:hypothetical protein